MTFTLHPRLLAEAPLRQQALVVFCFAALLRFIHLGFALRSPLSLQTGPDEDYYLRFAQDVANGSGGLVPEFTFMDPLYGYLLGLVLWLPGGSPALMFVLQVLVDAATAVGLLLVCRRLGLPGAGIVAALVYAVLGPAMAFSTALLKTTWVTAYLCWWMLLALHALDARTWRRWLAFGLYCGVGVALRANLLLMVPLAVALAWIVPKPPATKTGLRATALLCACLLAGLALPLALLVARNMAVDQRLSPVPTNGGVVLHQLNHPENPESRSPGLPSFVAYAHPSEIWRGYRDEAERRAGHPMDPVARDAYWRGEAVRYLREHPAQAVRNALRKLGEFSAYTEVPNNRSFADERRFSPLLRWLPQPFGWLFALGVPGLVLLVARDRRGWAVLAPVAMGLATIAVFFAEDRFRFNIVTPFVVGTAAWLAWLWQRFRVRDTRALAAGLALSALLGAWSIWQAARLPDYPMDWQRMATGHFKRGDHQALQSLLREVEAREPGAVGLDEFRGLVALSWHDYATARLHFERALAVRTNRHEVWHNYASALAGLGELDQALAAQAAAYQMHPGSEYAFRIGEYLERLGRTAEATAVFQSLVGRGEPWSSRAAERLSALGR